MVHSNFITISLTLILVTNPLEAFTQPLAKPRSSLGKEGINFIVQNPSETTLEEVDTIEKCSLNSPDKPSISSPTFLFSLLVEEKKINVTIIGNTTFTKQQIIQIPNVKNIVNNSQGKNLSLEAFNELYTILGNEITQYYLDQGYITSKAVIQPLETIEKNQDINIIIVEGKIAELNIKGRKKLASSYICDRLIAAITSPLNIIELEKQLRLLSLSPIFDSIDANLQPSGKQGLSIIVVTIKESDSWQFGIGIDNFSPPSIGSERTGTFLENNNLTGWADRLSVAYSRSTTDGGNTIDTTYTIPLNKEEGSLKMRVIPTWTRITQEPLNAFNITGNKQIYEISFRQPLWRKLSDEFALSMGFRYQNGQTLLNGELAPIENARNRSTILQFGQDYLKRDEQGFWFLRSQFNWGIDLFDATITSDSSPDSRFFSWLLQGQRIQRWNENHFMIIRGELQLTPDSLLPDQWFIIGGGQSVRGYRQNVRFGDNGVRLSIENRLKIVKNEDNKSTVEIAPFLDLGGVWFTSENENSPLEKFLIGTGLGLIWNNVANIEGLTLRVDYGIPLIPLPHFGNNLQEDGFYFQINYYP
ncbi:MAG: ShlB/FhaC/HecB family hemolysin secretion/activation protein [Crocosphaera sp.]|nr:ShlB/FhaC/HecB family hemolysin secretion/activation protein [Crocosphaera sp.]